MPFDLLRTIFGVKIQKYDLEKLSFYFGNIMTPMTLFQHI